MVYVWYTRYMYNISLSRSYLISVQLYLTNRICPVMFDQHIAVLDPCFRKSFLINYISKCTSTGGEQGGKWEY